MARQPKKTTSRKKGHSVPPRKPSVPSLRSLNRWLDQNYDELLRQAEANCIRLTGKPRL